jgi:hypothetical protein
MNNKLGCNCLIGFLCGDTVTISTFIDDVNRLIDNQMRSVRKSNPLDRKQIVDTRRGYLSKFSYCPRCGSRIDWEEIIDELNKQ